jgi:hypothetical protein
MVDMIDDQSEPVVSDEGQPLGLRRWAWAPWYAKIWWSLALLYWLSRYLSHKLDVLSWMNEPGFAGYFVVAFFPPLMLLVLAFGALRARLKAATDQLPVEEGDDGVSPSDIIGRVRSPRGRPFFLDPSDPRSGALWHGSSLNLLNANYVNRQR